MRLSGGDTMAASSLSQYRCIICWARSMICPPTALALYAPADCVPRGGVPAGGLRTLPPEQHALPVRRPGPAGFHHVRVRTPAGCSVGRRKRQCLPALLRMESASAGITLLMLTSGSGVAGKTERARQPHAEAPIMGSYVITDVCVLSCGHWPIAVPVPLARVPSLYSGGEHPLLQRDRPL